MNALFLKDLADKTRRGLEGRVEAGRSGGGLCYGYDVVRRRARRAGAASADQRRRGRDRPAHLRGVRRRPVAEGDRPAPERRGRRRARAASSGATPPSAATGSAAPASSTTSSTSAGWSGTGCATSRTPRPAGASRGRTRRRPGSSRRSPSCASSTTPSGSGSRRARPRSTPTRRCRRSRPAASGSTAGRAPADRPRSLRRTAAAACRAVGRDYLACANARNKGTCDQRKAIRRAVLEEFVLDLIRDRMMQPDAVEAFIAAYTARDQRRPARGGRRRGGSAGAATLRPSSTGSSTPIAGDLRTPGLLAQDRRRLERRARRASSRQRSPAAERRRRCGCTPTSPSLPPEGRGAARGARRPGDPRRGGGHPARADRARRASARPKRLGDRAAGRDRRHPGGARARQRKSAPPGLGRGALFGKGGCGGRI